jgi:hypothetical protein
MPYVIWDAVGIVTGGATLSAVLPAAVVGCGIGAASGAAFGYPLDSWALELEWKRRPAVSSDRPNRIHPSRSLAIGQSAPAHHLAVDPIDLGLRLPLPSVHLGAAVTLDLTLSHRCLVGLVMKQGVARCRYCRHFRVPLRRVVCSLGSREQWKE